MADALTEIIAGLARPEPDAVEAIGEIGDQPTLVALHLAERRGRRRQRVLAAIEARGLQLELGPVNVIGDTLREDIVRAVASMHGSRPRSKPLPDLEPDEVYPAPADGDFEDEATGRFYEFMTAPDLEEIAAGVLRDYGASLEAALDWNITYLWKRKGGSDRGKPKLGTCQRVSGLAAFYTGDQFLVLINADAVRDFQLSRRQMDALLFHELCHVGTTEKYAPTTVPHDVEMFTEEVLIFGPWTSDLRRMALQLQLPVEVAP